MIQKLLRSRTYPRFKFNEGERHTQWCKYNFREIHQKETCNSTERMHNLEKILKWGCAWAEFQTLSMFFKPVHVMENERFQKRKCNKQR